MTSNRYQQYVANGISGGVEDVDVLMNALVEQDDLATVKLVDYALSLVNTRHGKLRLEYYFFNGSIIQRNYAALYFKRRGNTTLLHEAVCQGKVDTLQAYAK